MKTKPELKVKFVTDADAKEMTPDMFCRIFTGKSEATLVRELQQFGVDRLLRQMTDSAIIDPTIQGGVA